MNLIDIDYKVRIKGRYQWGRVGNQFILNRAIAERNKTGMENSWEKKPWNCRQGKKYASFPTAVEEDFIWSPSDKTSIIKRVFPSIPADHITTR